MPDNFTGYIPDHKVSGHKLSDLCMLQRGLREIPPLPLSCFLSFFTSLPLFWPQESWSIQQRTTAGMGYCKPLISWPTNHRLNPLKPESKTNLPYYTENIRNLIKKQKVGWPIIWRNLFQNCTRLNELWFDWPQLQRGLIGNFQNNKKHCPWKEIILNRGSKTPYPVRLTLQPMPVWGMSHWHAPPLFFPITGNWSYFLKRSALEILEGNNSALLTYFSRFIRTFQWSRRDINILTFPWVEIHTYLPCSSQKSPVSLNIYFCSKEASDLRLCRIRLYRP